MSNIRLQNRFADFIEDHEIDNDIEITRTDSLGRGTPIYHHFGITLSYPHTKTFLNMTSEIQSKLYRKMWNDIKNCLGIPKDFAYTLEYNKNGQVHSHGYITIETYNNISAIGGVSDLAKVIHKLLPKKYSNFNPNHLYQDLIRYKHASHTVQYYSDICHNINDPATIDYWKNYMVKDINKYKL